VGSIVPEIVVRDAQRRVQVRRLLRGIVGHEIEAMVFGRADLPRSRARYRDVSPATAGCAEIVDWASAALECLAPEWA
jgi:hypothetical protein